MNDLQRNRQAVDASAIGQAETAAPARIEVTSPITIATIDDDILARRAIMAFAVQDRHFRCVADFSNGDLALTTLRGAASPQKSRGTGSQPVSISQKSGSPSFHPVIIPQIILLDVFMPGLNGLETLHLLRQLSPSWKIIMCSACDDPKIIDFCHHLGATGYQVKPITNGRLCQALIEACGTSTLWPGHPAQVLPAAMIAAQSAELLASYTRKIFFSQTAEPSVLSLARRMILRANAFCVCQLANTCHCSVRTLQNRIILPVAHTPFQFLDAEAKQEALELLRNSVPTPAIANQLGFSKLPAFYKTCQRGFGQQPSALAGPPSSGLSET